MSTRALRRVPPAPTVIKFGGPALRSPARVVAEVRRRGPYSLVAVVASARQGVTNLLEQATRASAAEVPKEMVEELRRRHPSSARSVSQELERAAELFDRKPSRAVSRPWWREQVRSVGERLAVRWLAGEFRSRGMASIFLDADHAGLQVVGRPGSGRIDVEGSRVQVRRALFLAWRARRIPILTGYFGDAGRNGVSTLGRNGSDYTATALGELLQASTVELVKPTGALREANSLLRRDPSDGTPLGYSDAERLARSGTGILHPRSVGPVRRAAIALGLVALHGSGERDLWFGPQRIERRRDAHGMTGEWLGPESRAADPGRTIGALAS